MKVRALAGLGLAALVCAPPASADVPGLSPFFGVWRKHESNILISAAGIGVVTYQDLALCPTGCSEAGAPMGTLIIRFTSVNNGVASGSVAATSDAQNARVGEPVLAKLKHIAAGTLLTLTIAGQERMAFCDKDAGLAGECGA
jgi:hypothetical protein